MNKEETYTAFDGTTCLFRGAFQDVMLKVKQQMGRANHTSILIFSDATGKTMDFNFEGGTKDVLKRLEVYVSKEEQSQGSLGPGRPKLGVTSREVSLLPRHWEWLATQSGGASATLRKLVDEAKKKTLAKVSLKQAQERVYRFMSVIAGDSAGYEEALRALYKRDQKGFLLHIRDWPRDIKSHVVELAKPVFEVE
jgi:hypothetical protein